MASPESTRAARAVNPLALQSSILGFIEAGIAVVPRPDLGAVELRIRDAEQTTVIVLRPQQVMAVAALLIAAVATVEP